MNMNDKRVEVKRIEKLVMTRIKDVARLSGKKCNITIDEVMIPEFCPLTGVKIEYQLTKSKNNFSVRRIDMKKGCVKGNIQIIAKQAMSVLKEQKQKIELKIKKQQELNELQMQKRLEIKRTERERHLHKLVMARSRLHKVGCTLKLEDIVIPEKCPVLGIPLTGDFLNSGDNTPIIERIHPEREYTKDNIIIMSRKVQKLKVSMGFLKSVDIAKMLTISKFYEKMNKKVFATVG